MKSRFLAASMGLVMLMSLGITQTSFAATPKGSKKEWTLPTLETKYKEAIAKG